jgi:hypothetical protein
VRHVVHSRPVWRTEIILDDVPKDRLGGGSASCPIERAGGIVALFLREAQLNRPHYALAHYCPHPSSDQFMTPGRSPSAPLGPKAT